MVYKIDITNEGGVIWTEKPERKNLEIAHGRGAAELSGSAFSVSGDSLACLDPVRRVLVIFLVSKNRFYTIEDVAGLETGLAFQFSTSPNANLLFVALSNGHVNIYDTERETLVHTLVGPHRQGVKFISFNKAGNECATSSDDMLVIWRQTTHQSGPNSEPYVRIRMLDLSSVPHSLFLGKYASLAKVDHMIVTMQDGSISLWRSADMLLLHEQPAPPVLLSSPSPSYFSSASISYDTAYLVLAGNAPVLYVYHFKQENERHSIQFSHHIDLQNFASSVVSVSFVPPIIKNQGYWLCILTDDGVVRFINVLTSNSVNCEILLEIPPASRDIFVSFTLSAHGRYLACSSHKGIVFLYDVFAAFHELNVPSIEYHNVQTTSPNAKLSSSQTKLKSSTKSNTKTKAASPVKTSPQKEISSSLFPVPKQEQEFNEKSLPGLSQERVLSLLRSYGEYPSKYRIFIWKFLLGLPENHEAYANLLKRGTHFAYTNLHLTLPIKNRRLFKKMERNLSLITHWSPVFGEVEYLPDFIFPFLKLINDDIVCFETIITFLVNWCDEWFEFYPHPPLVVLQQIETLLEIHDPKLLAHFYFLSVTPVEYAYPLMTTLMSEVLHTDEWLVLFDHIVSNPPSFFLFIIVSYLRYFRSAILHIEAKEDLEFFLHRINANDIHHIMRLAYKTRMATNLSDLPETKPFMPLPKGQYPIFNKVPKRRFNHQIREIERIRKEEETYLAKKRSEVLQTVHMRM